MQKEPNPAQMQGEMLPPKFIIYLARHASPDRTRVDIPYFFPPGPDLTETGREEAAQLGAFLRAAGEPLLVCSPLDRTLHTAAIAGGTWGAQAAAVDEDLAEWRPGEKEPSVLERMQRALTTAAQRSYERSGPVALVTHGGPLMVILKGLGAPGEAIDRCRIYDNRNPVSPAGAWRVERLDGRLRIEMAFVPSGYAMPAEDARCHYVPLNGVAFPPRLFED